MKSFLSYVTLSFLATTTIVQAGFNTKVFEERDPYRIVQKVNKRLYILNRKEEYTNTHKDLIRNERKALDNLLKAKLGQELYDATQEHFRLNAVLNFKDALGSRTASLPTLVSNSDLKSLVHRIQTADKPDDKHENQTLLSCLTALKKSKQSDDTGFGKSLIKYNRAVSARKSNVLKFNPEKASLEDFTNRWKYLRDKNLVDNKYGYFYTSFPSVTMNNTLAYYQSTYKRIQEERRKQTERDGDVKNDKYVSTKQIKRALSIHSDGSILLNGKPLEKKEALKGKFESFKMEPGSHTILKVSSTKTEGSNPPHYMIVFYKGKVIDLSRDYNGKGEFVSYGDKHYPLDFKQFNPDELKIYLFDEAYNYNQVELPKKSIRFVKTPHYWENVLTVTEKREVLEFNRPLVRNKKLNGLIIPTYLGDSMLNIVGACGVDKVGPAQMLAVLYNGVIIGSLEYSKYAYNYSNEHEEAVSKNPSISRKFFFEGDVYLYNLTGEYNPNNLISCIFRI